MYPWPGVSMKILSIREWCVWLRVRKGSDDGNGKLKTVVMEAAVAVVKRRLQLWLKVDRQ